MEDMKRRGLMRQLGSLVKLAIASRLLKWNWRVLLRGRWNLGF